VQAFAQRLRAVIKTMVIKTEPSSKNGQLSVCGGIV